MAASVLVLQNREVVEAVMETLWPPKLKILMILLFIEKVRWPLVQMNGAPWSAAPACALGPWEGSATVKDNCLGSPGSSWWVLPLADPGFTFQTKSYSSWQTWVMCPVAYFFSGIRTHHPRVCHRAIVGTESWSLPLRLPSFEHTPVCQYSPLTVGSQNCVRSSRKGGIQSSEEKRGLALWFCALGLCVTWMHSNHSMLQLWLQDQSFQCVLYGLLLSQVVSLSLFFFAPLSHSCQNLFIFPEYGILTWSLLSIILLIL